MRRFDVCYSECDEVWIEEDPEGQYIYYEEHLKLVNHLDELIKEWRRRVQNNQTGGFSICAHHVQSILDDFK